MHLSKKIENLFINCVVPFIRKRIWYIFLLSISTMYVFHYRFNISSFDTLDSINLIFILWLILLFWPIISEMEFLGIKIKKEVEASTQPIKDNIEKLQAQIVQIQMSNTVSNNISVGNSPLPSEDKIEELLSIARNLQHTSKDPTSSKFTVPINNINIYLFTVRFQLESALHKLCEKTKYPPERTTLIKMANFLTAIGIINENTFDLIRQVNSIANKGIHGLEIDNKYVDLVSKIFPEIMRQLEIADSRLNDEMYHINQYD